MPPENLAVVQRWFEEVWNQRRSETIDELLIPESVCHADDGPMHGPDEFKQRMYKPFIAAFPDLHVTVEAIVAHDDQVVVRWTAAGAHRGEGLGFAATQQPVSFQGITWLCVRDGKLVEGWQSTNIPEVIRSLGP